PVRKSLVCGDADGGFSALLGATHLTAELMEHSRSTQGKTQAEGVCTLLRQRHCFLAPHQPLVRITQVPQRPGVLNRAYHASILPIEKRVGAVLIGVVEGYTLCVMPVC